MTITTIGLLSPGDMGHSVGAVLQRNGLQVLTCLDGRSERSRALAAEAGIEDTASITELVDAADIFLSILPPARAVENAERIAAALRETGADLLYVDCNAIAPRTAQAVAAVVTAAGARFADIGIIGAPPRRPGTRFYASGPGAEELLQLRDYGLDIRVLEGGVGQASGLKMCYGALTKGLQALGVELLVAARALGLEDALRQEQQQSTPDVRAWIENAIPTMPPKAYRWVGEMEEIALCFEDVGLTPKIFQGAADIYRFVETTAIGHETPENRDKSRDGMGVVAALTDELPRH